MGDGAAPHAAPRLSALILAPRNQRGLKAIVNSTRGDGLAERREVHPAAARWRRVIHKLMRYKVRRADLDAVLALVASFVDEVGRKEGGTALYRALQHGDDPTRFTHYMVFRTKSAEDNHHKQPWTRAFHQKLAPLCEEAPQTLDAKPVGGS